MILQIQSKENRISLYAVQSDLGKNESNFECKVEGDNLKIAFSSKLLSDILNHIDSEKILFECSEAIRPGVFKIDDDNNFIHLVMPMMLNLIIKLRLFRELSLLSPLSSNLSRNLFI